MFNFLASSFHDKDNLDIITKMSRLSHLVVILLDVGKNVRFGAGQLTVIECANVVFGLKSLFIEYTVFTKQHKTKNRMYCLITLAWLV